MSGYAEIWIYKSVWLKELHDLFPLVNGKVMCVDPGLYCAFHVHHGIIDEQGFSRVKQTVQQNMMEYFRGWLS